MACSGFFVTVTSFGFCGIFESMYIHNNYKKVWWGRFMTFTWLVNSSKYAASSD